MRSWTSGSLTSSLRFAVCITFAGCGTGIPIILLGIRSHNIYTYNIDAAVCLCFLMQTNTDKRALLHTNIFVDVYLCLLAVANIYRQTRVLFLFFFFSFSFLFLFFFFSSSFLFLFLAFRHLSGCRLPSRPLKYPEQTAQIPRANRSNTQSKPLNGIAMHNREVWSKYLLLPAYNTLLLCSCSKARPCHSAYEVIQ